MANPFETMARFSGFSGRPFTVTPHATTNFENVARYFYIGGAGDVALVRVDDVVVVYVGLPAGSWLLAGGKRINAIGTTATNIVGHE